MQMARVRGHETLGEGRQDVRRETLDASLASRLMSDCFCPPLDASPGALHALASLRAAVLDQATSRRVRRFRHLLGEQARMRVVSACDNGDGA